MMWLSGQNESIPKEVNTAPPIGGFWPGRTELSFLITPPSPPIESEFMNCSSTSPPVILAQSAEIVRWSTSQDERAGATEATLIIVLAEAAPQSDKAQRTAAIFFTVFIF